MGIQNEMDDGQGLNQVLSRRYGIQGPPAPNMATEVFPTISVEPLAPEYQFLCNHRLAVAGIAQAGVVAERAQVGIQNPVDSGVIAVVEALQVMGVVNSQTFRVFMGVGAQTWDASGTRVFRDTRFGIIANATTLIAVRQSGAVPLGSDTTATFIEKADTMVDIPGPYVLGPGGFVTVVQDAVNQSITAMFTWRERAVTKGELLGAVVT